jgi:transcription antitermination factor NusG
VPEGAIALVQKRLTQIEAKGGLHKIRFRSGDTVLIRDGPLTGLEAVFREPLGAGDRVRILVRFLGEANHAVVPVDMLEPTTPRIRPPRRTRGRGRKIKSRR